MAREKTAGKTPIATLDDAKSQSLTLCEWNTKLDTWTYRYCSRPRGHDGEHDFGDDAGIDFEQLVVIASLQNGVRDLRAKLLSASRDYDALVEALKAITDHWDGYERNEGEADDPKGARLIAQAKTLLHALAEA